MDAVDTVSAKIELVLKAQEHNIPIISSMGAGNKVDSTQFKITDIYKTKVCPLAKSCVESSKKDMLKIKKLFILKKNHFAQLMIYPSVANTLYMPSWYKT